MRRNARVQARHHENGMAIYVQHNGQETFVMTHRENNGLYFHLCDNGRTLDDLKNYKPGKNKGKQRLHKSLSYVIKVTEYVLDEVA